MGNHPSLPRFQVHTSHPRWGLSTFRAFGKSEVKWRCTNGCMWWIVPWFSRKGDENPGFITYTPRKLTAGSPENEGHWKMGFFLGISFRCRFLFGGKYPVVFPNVGGSNKATCLGQEKLIAPFQRLAILAALYCKDRTLVFPYKCLVKLLKPSFFSRW